MRHLLTAAAFLMASPAFAGPECSRPPGSLAGTATWSTNEKIIEMYLTTSNRDRYTCSPNVKQNNPSDQVGSKGYFKQTCGTLTLVKEVPCRNCTFEESAGISSGSGRLSDAIGAMSKYLCVSRSNITSDTRYELRDKNGQASQLDTEYGFNTGNSKISETWTSNTKTQFYTKSWRVGSTSKEISLTRVTEYQVESIKQPSL